MVRFTLLALAILATSVPTAARGQDAEVKALRAEVELLRAKLEAANRKAEKLQIELDLVRKGGKVDGAKTLAERLLEGSVLKGDFTTTNLGKDNYMGSATLTVSSRKDSAVKGTLLFTAPGKPNYEHEVTGSVVGESLTLKSVSAPKQFTANGAHREGYLTLQWSGETTKARLRLKVQ